MIESEAERAWRIKTTVLAIKEIDAQLRGGNRTFFRETQREALANLRSRKDDPIFLHAVQKQATLMGIEKNVVFRVLEFARQRTQA